METLVESEAPVEDAARTEQDAPVRDEPPTLLIEELTIDGMCGVY